MTSAASSATLAPIDVQTQAATTAAKPAGAPHRGIIGTLFHEILDIINPLQHIPIISTIYRHLTGDAISPVAKVAGGALYGGLIGLGLSVADVAVQEATGEDTGDHIWALLQGKPSDKAAPATALAAATPGPAAATAAAPVDDRVWFPAHPAGSTRPKALYYQHTAPAPAAAAAAPAPGTVPAVQPPAPASQTVAALAPATPNPASQIPASQIPTPLARAAAAPTPTPGGVPQMDQATFDALLRSFGGQAVAGITPAPTRQPQPGTSINTAPANTAPANTGPTNLRPVAAPAASLPVAKSYDAALQAMQSALDRYQAHGGRIPPQMPIGAPRAVPAI